MLTIWELHPLFEVNAWLLFWKHSYGNAFKPRFLADFICCTAFRVSSEVKVTFNLIFTSS
ncbi:Uncharacterized protein BM_BM1125 [Brugia malayi]|uniref:Bm1125 n=1 Tax=Brugia malayi TaxID=6279 RepID=A0A0K0IR43_BRUMA|nr:Uncharacterized protein BM_BM1125 [Brugia malayi]CDQ03328.1 Bm1125 [Brugia malayi]VIO96998.1 Uncharacterized protein BM_BM1125 [Brugia malayi]